MLTLAGKTADCTGDVCVGDVILFKEAVYSGPFRNPTLLGDRWLKAKVIADSYGAKKQQHTFILQVLESAGQDPLDPGASTRRKGRNIYRNGTTRLLWDDEKARSRMLEEKHRRGKAARSARERRLEGESLLF